MKTMRVASLAAVGRALKFPYQRVLRAHAKGIIKKVNGTFDVQICRLAIEAASAQRAAGDAPDPILLKWARRKKRAEALRLEKAVNASEGQDTLPLLAVRKAWRACESMWVQQLRTIARQAGANWGGKLGKDIEALLVKLHDEMFRRMAGDPILNGMGPPPPQAGGETA
jgi:hypothetical protein